MKKEPPAHLYLFLTGDPKKNFWVATGHAVLNLEEKTSEGIFTVRANDKSWLVHTELVDGYSFDEETGIFSAQLAVTTIAGDPPFPSVVNFPAVPIDELTPGANTSGLFTYVTAEPPPMAPGANK